MIRPATLDNTERKKTVKSWTRSKKWVMLSGKGHRCCINKRNNKNNFFKVRIFLCKSTRFCFKCRSYRQNLKKQLFKTNLTLLIHMTRCTSDNQKPTLPISSLTLYKACFFNNNKSFILSANRLIYKRVDSQVSAAQLPNNQYLTTSVITILHI